MCDALLLDADALPSRGDVLGGSSSLIEDLLGGSREMRTIGLAAAASMAACAIRLRRDRAHSPTWRLSHDSARKFGGHFDEPRSRLLVISRALSVSRSVLPVLSHP